MTVPPYFDVEVASRRRRFFLISRLLSSLTMPLRVDDRNYIYSVVLRIFPTLFLPNLVLPPTER